MACVYAMIPRRGRVGGGGTSEGDGRRECEGRGWGATGSQGRRVRDDG